MSSLEYLLGMDMLRPSEIVFNIFLAKKVTTIFIIGLCVGVCIMGFGIGALFFNLILLQLINPDNDKFDEHHRCSQDIANNLPIALRIICGLYVTLGLIGCLLIRPPKII